MSNKPRSPDPRQALPLRPADFQVLLILTERPLHAYGISKAVDDQPGGQVQLEIGSLYRTLNRMMTAGLIEETEAKTKGPRGQARRYYRITRFGRRVAKAEAKRLSEVLEVARDRRLLTASRNG